MPWARLDDQFYNHPKVAALGEFMLPCVGLHVLALCYCNAYLTDGLIPRDQVPRLAGDVTRLMQEGHAWGLVEDLVRVGMWEQADDDFRIHDFLDYNPSKREVLQLRKIRRLSGKAGGLAKSKQVASKRLANAVAESNQKRAPSPSPSPSPEEATTTPLVASKPTGAESNGPRGRASEVQMARDSAEFYDRYPRHVGKRAADLAYRAARRRHNTHAEIMAGLERQRATFLAREKDKVPHPATWLHGDRWKDEAEEAVNPYLGWPEMADCRTCGSCHDPQTWPKECAR